MKDLPRSADEATPKVIEVVRRYDHLLTISTLSGMNCEAVLKEGVEAIRKASRYVEDGEVYAISEDAAKELLLQWKSGVLPS